MPLDVALNVRATLYETLAYYEARANRALLNKNMGAHVQWALKYHRLKKLLED